MKKRLSKVLIEKTQDNNVLSIVTKEFRNYVQKALELSLSLNQSRKELAGTMDCFDYHFRGYVCGKFNRMHRVYFELRRFEKTKLAKECIFLMFDHIENILVENEIYELMDRFISAKQKCVKLINQINPIEIDLKKLNNERN